MLPTIYKYLIAALCVIALIAAIWIRADANGAARVQAKWNEQAAIDAAAARAKEQEYANRYQAALAAGTERERQAREDAYAAGVASVSVRESVRTIVKYLPANSPAACTNAVNALGDVFSQCTERYSALAAIADRHANDARTLVEAWPKSD